MRLFQKEHLERAALARWGSLAALEGERERRQQRREQRSIASFFQQQQEEQEEQQQLLPMGEEQEQMQMQQPMEADGQQQSQLAVRDAQQQQQEQEQDHMAAAERQQQQQQANVGRQQQQQQAPATPAAGPATAAVPPLTAAAASRQLPWLQALPPLIAERVCLVPRPLPSAVQAVQQQQQPGQYVLYWMKTAVRGHENPALDAAAAAARHLHLPLVVASFLLSSHPYASARRYTFVLEGLRDVQAELCQQGVELVVYLEGYSEQEQQQERQEGQTAGSTEPAISTGGGTAAPQKASRAAAAGAAEADPYLPGFSFRPAAEALQQSAGWQALARLASGAAVVITEDMPVPPDADWLQALAQQLPPAVQMAAVDTACLLPMRLVRKCHDKAYTFRSATEAQRKQRLRTYTLPTPQPSPTATATAALIKASAGLSTVVGPAAVAPAQLQGLQPLPPSLLGPKQQQQWLGWWPLDLAAIPQQQLQQRLKELLLCCPGINHSVPAVRHLAGGSSAGYARWEQFRKRGLALYGARRNDAMQRDGVSRLSPYHHWGMVSPFKIAREAALDRSAGATKFLDEFLVWREIGFNTCLHRHHQLHSLAALPQWAQQTLELHAGDPRAAVLQYCQLDSGTTGDAFWDAAQRQLVKTGELHNNVRMTWGKAFLQWAPSPQAALSAALHCNHRWALDGCDPASYAGVLWCFGMYDNPKAAGSTPVSGSLAQRSTAAHGRRLPPIPYAQLAA